LTKQIPTLYNLSLFAGLIGYNLIMDQFDLFYDEDWDDYEAAYGLRYNPQRIELSSEEADKLLRSALLRLGYRPGQNPLRGSDIEELARNLGYSRATAYKWPRGFISGAAKITEHQVSVCIPEWTRVNH